MTAILCVDDNSGVMFNSRRQSQDRVLREKILSFLKDGKKLRVSPYTAAQFSTEDKVNLVSAENCYADAAPDDVCFAEDASLDVNNSMVDTIVLFKWNRTYPADRHFDCAQLKTWKLVHSEDFAGYSHEKITMEVYMK